MSSQPNIIAVAEEEPLAWVERSISRWAATRAIAEEFCERHPRFGFFRFKVSKCYMRPASEVDCPAWPHDVDEDGEVPDACTCWHIEEGLQFECELDAPGAIPVWRVEERPHRLRYRFYRLADVLYWHRRYRPRRVLWGSRVDRRSTWLERKLGATFVLLGDTQIRLNQSEWRYCDVCGGLRPHSCVGRGRCQGNDHFDRQLGVRRGGNGVTQ